MPDHSLDERIAAVRAELGERVTILGHHYQRDEVIRFADFTGDSYRLSKLAAETKSHYIVFCGVHFMAESADVLSRPNQQVILPDLNAGCSMADMAEIGQVEDCWEQLVAAGLTNDEGDGITPITYMNSTAAIKAFCGRRSGVVCTSSNAGGAFKWAFAKTDKVLFLPDQHLGRNTAYALGIPLSDMAVWDPWQIMGGQTPDRLRRARVVLWKGHCSVHQRFLPEHVDRMRAEFPGIHVIAHPECRWEVCQKADSLGSTEQFIKTIGAKNLAVELLPPYAPDLNPVEWLWKHLKKVEMANLTCRDLEELHGEFHLAVGRVRGKPRLFPSFFEGAELAI